MADKVDEAIAATEEPAEKVMVKMFRVEGQLPTGRPFQLALPADVTPIEVLGLVSFITGDGLVEMYRQATETPAGRLAALGLTVPGRGG